MHHSMLHCISPGRMVVINIEEAYNQGFDSRQYHMPNRLFMQLSDYGFIGDLSKDGKYEKNSNYDR